MNLMVTLELHYVLEIDQLGKRFELGIQHMTQAICHIIMKFFSLGVVSENIVYL